MRRLLFALVVLKWISLAVFAAETDRTRQTSAALTNFISNLPVIFLEAKEPIVSEQKVACSVRMVLPEGAEPGSTGALAGVVRFHGATSQAYPKKSFGITLDGPVRWLGMRESAHWVLNAAHVDRSLMRHKLSYDLFRALSAGDAKRFAAASRFVELNLNGKYHGAYLLMERVDRTMLELRSYESNATSQACIYKAVDHAANFRHPGHAGYEQRDPDPLLRAYWKPLDDFNRFVSTAPDAEFFHPETGIGSRLDLDNAIDFHLLVLLTSNMDGIDKNFILARDALRPGAPNPRFFFAPWDYDATFGRHWNATRVEPTAWLSNHLFDRLLNDAAYRKKFAARWKALRHREFSVSNVQRLIDENARTLGDATKRNAARWRTLSGYPDRLSFAADVMQMKEWITARVQWLDQEIERMASR